MDFSFPSTSDRAEVSSQREEPAGAQLSRQSWQLMDSPAVSDKPAVIEERVVKPEEASGRTDSSDKSQNWLQTGFLSYHLNRDQAHTRHFREQNYGIGFEHKLSEDSSLSIGYYRNSLDRNSFYAGYNWSPINAGAVKLGVIGGVISGYPALNKGGAFPMLLPVASLEGKAVGINLTYVPRMKDVSSVVALQLKFKIP